MLKDAPGGTHIVLTGKGPKGTTLMAIGFIYRSKSTLFFVCKKDSGSTRKGKPYKMKFKDTWGQRMCPPSRLSKSYISDF